MIKKYEYAILALILILGIFFRFYDLKNTPPGLYPDEAMNGSNALEALETGNFKIFYPENNGREGLFINIQALAIKLFGNEPWALRGVSGVFGSLGILAVYLLGKELFIRSPQMLGVPIAGSLIGLTSAFFISANYWHVNFSRIGFRAIMVPTLIAFGLYWLLKAFRTEKISNAVFAGLFLGLGFHTYIAFRVAPLLLAVLLGKKIWDWRKNRKTITAPAPACAPCIALAVIFVIFLTALPIGWYFFNHPADFSGRGGQVSIFSAERPAYELLRSTIYTLGMFNAHGDCNERHNFRCQPELYWPVGIFFIIGFFSALTAIFKRQSEIKEQSLTLLFGFAVFMLPAILTREGLPHALRSIGMLPFVMIMAGIGFVLVWQKINNYFNLALNNSVYQDKKRQIIRVRREIIGLLCLILLLVALNLFSTYHLRFASSKDAYFGFSANLTAIARYLQTVPENTAKYVIVNGGGDLVRGIPISSQPIMFLTGTFTEKSRAAKNTRYILETEIASIPQKSPLLTAASEDDGELARISSEQRRNDVPSYILPINLSRELLLTIKSRFPKIIPSVPGEFAVFEVR